MLNGNSKCSICGGTGKLYPLNADGSVNYNKVVTCGCILQDMDAERTKNFLKTSGIGSLGKYTFAHLCKEDKGQNPSYSAALKKAEMFAQAPSGWLYIQGSYSATKSQVAAAIAMETLNKNQSAAYKTAVEAISLMRSPLDDETVYTKSLEFLRSCDLLIIDEVQPKLSAWEQERLCELLISRYRADLPSVIASSCLPDELSETWSAKINDRTLCQVCDLGENMGNEDSDTNFDKRFVLQKKMTFASFNPSRSGTKEQSYSLKAACKAAQSFAESPEGWLILMGAPGVGKTHLAAAIANTRYALGERCLFASVPELADSLRKAYSGENNQSYDELLSRVKNTPLLVLDDFGEEAPTAWSTEKLYQIISYRYNAQLPMVITSSRSIDELAKRDERVASRFSDYNLSTLLAIKGSDFRRHGTAPAKTFSDK